MKFFIGSDIEQVSRFKKLLDTKPRILKKIFHEKEYEYAINSKNPDQVFTGTWCAKEAVIKSFGEFFLLTPRCVEIYREENGAPKCNVLSELVKGQVFQIKLSISHTADYALGSALLILE
jgi:holo-[acyl-carrier protein] synthase